MSAEAALGQLDVAIEKLEAFPLWLNETINAVVARVNAALEAAPPLFAAVIGEIADLARQLLVQIVTLAADFIAWQVEHVLPVITGPKVLYDSGNQWTTTVYQEVTQVSGQINLSETGLDDYWGGPAATAYAQTVDRQRAAVDKVAEAVSTVREAIQGLAFTLLALYVALAAALIAAGIAIAGGSAAVATVLGIPPGLVVIISGLVTGIASVGTIFAIGQQLIAGTMEQFSTLLELKNDGSAFDKGRWPQATADLDDGSARDGTSSKWSMNQ